MLQRGMQNQIIPPMFISGKTEDDIRTWYRQMVGEDVYRIIEADPEFPLLDIAAGMYNRKRMLWLLDNLEKPADEEEREFVTAARRGELISLLLPEELEMETVFSPVIRCEGNLWCWSLNGGEPSAPHITAQGCVEDYVKAMELAE